jgi:hypothetical protein
MNTMMATDCITVADTMNKDGWHDEDVWLF